MSVPQHVSHCARCSQLCCAALQDACLDPADLGSLATLPALRSLRLQLPHERKRQPPTQLWDSIAGLTACRSLTALALAHGVTPVFNRPLKATRKAIRLSADSLQRLQPLLHQLDSFGLEGGQWVFLPSADRSLGATEAVLGSCRRLRLQIRVPSGWQMMNGPQLTNLHSLELTVANEENDRSEVRDPCSVP